MPRNGSGTYSLPAGNPVVSGTTIQSTWANSTLNDVGDAITGSLARDGTGGMSGPLRLADGTVSIPGLAFAAETTTGLSRPTTNAIVASVSAVEKMRINASGASVTGTLGVSGDVAINTDKFNVTAASGNTLVAGTLGVTGLITATGGVSGAVTSSSATITGGTINGTTIGATTPSTGAFTTASASTSVTTPSVTNAGTLALSATGANVITAATNGAERVRIDSSGNVGIGTTSPAYPLQVRRAGGAGSLGISIDSVGATDRTVQYFSIQDTAASLGTGHAFYYRVPSSTTDVLGLMLDEAGKVGIGTSSPAEKLHVNGSVVFGGTAAYQTITQDGSNNFVLNSWNAQIFQTASTEQLRIRTDGSLWTNANAQPGFFARAWVNFDGTGTVAIRASGNVSSITDNGVGDYTINFTTAMVDTNYSPVSMSTGISVDDGGLGAAAKTTTAFRFSTIGVSGARNDYANVSVAIFR